MLYKMILATVVLALSATQTSAAPSNVLAATADLEELKAMVHAQSAEMKALKAEVKALKGEDEESVTEARVPGRLSYASPDCKVARLKARVCGT